MLISGTLSANLNQYLKLLKGVIFDDENAEQLSL